MSVRPKKDRQGGIVPEVFLIDFRDAENVRHAFQFSGTLEGALSLERQILKDEGELRPTQQTTFADLCAYYESICSRQRYWRSKRTIVARLKDALGPNVLNVMSVQIFKQYKASLEARPFRRGKTGGPRHLSVATVNRYLSCLRGMIREAVDAGMCDRRVLEDLRKVKPQKERNARLRYLESQAAAEPLLEQCRQNRRAPHLFPLVLMALHTGMRKGELLALRWREVDLRNRVVGVIDTKNGERRDLQMSKRLTEALSSMPRPIDDGARVFGVSNVKRSFPLACRKAGLRDFRFHDLRHTYASWQAMSGMPMPTLQRLLGHKSLNMTLRYSHLSPDHMAIATRLFDNPAMASMASTID